ncbi:MobF family relaxase [Branchiibius sp. NY16-3462-2]|uniref:MobF family relaxase n=1 Tax=Branchiibius sp. NY16-3462-2 TaxID=1807500 RepID=UPI0025BA7493|nr:MobF family relaxase [Branchiibius sp. NY16-3462-2]
MKFYRGAAGAARFYVEKDHSRADDYYLAEGSGIACRYVADVTPTGTAADPATQPIAVRQAADMDGDTYEQWVAGYQVATGAPKGRLRTDGNALRFVEVVVNGPKTWSIAAALHPDIADAYDAAQERAAQQIITWLAQHSTTRVGPRGRQVQVPVEQLEAAVVKHYTSRAGDPHRHLHLQVNARVFAAGAWRGLHSVGTVQSIEAINGIGHAAVMCDPGFRTSLEKRGYELGDDGEIRQLAPYLGAFSHRAAQITANGDRYEAAWRTEHPGHEPGPRLRQSWDRRAWAEHRPDKPTPHDATPNSDGGDLVARWNQELLGLDFHPPAASVRSAPVSVDAIRRDVAADLVLSRLGARRSSWNAADIRGETEKLIASVGVVADPAARTNLAESITGHAVSASVSLLDRDDSPEHVRALTSARVLAVEADLNSHMETRAISGAQPAVITGADHLDPTQRGVVAALAGRTDLLLIEGAAGSGKTTTLAAARTALNIQGRRLVVVTPTLKAAHAAQEQVGTDAFSAAWLIHQYGHRWDGDGNWTHAPNPAHQLDTAARLRPGDVLLVDEAGMLDQDTARALFDVATSTGATVALLGDRHQLPAVGRGGILELAASWVHHTAHLELSAVHRFTDPAYADLTLAMRDGQHPEQVFDQLLAQSQIILHGSDAERTAALAQLGAVTGALVMADTREQVSTLNAAIRHQRHEPTDAAGVVTRSGQRIGVGDRVATRLNNAALGVANRATWIVTGLTPDGGITVTDGARRRELPGSYVQGFVELAYATTVYGAQGHTVDHAHLLIGEATGAAAAYVGMTRGRHTNTAHLVAENLDDARRLWVDVFNRDHADLGPAHAASLAADDIERYGTQTPRQAASATPRRPEPSMPSMSPSRQGHGISR